MRSGHTVLYAPALQRSKSTTCKHVVVPQRKREISNLYKTDLHLLLLWVIQRVQPSIKSKNEVTATIQRWALESVGGWANIGCCGRNWGWS